MAMSTVNATNNDAASDDDSSSASSSASDDYALNFDIFSQNSLAAKSDQNDNEENDDDISNGNGAKVNAALQDVDGDKNEDQTATVSGANDYANAAIEEKARQVANSIDIDKQISSPQNLFWLTSQRNRSRPKINPVRIPPDDSEYIGYKDVLRIKDPTRQCVVQYLQFPHVEITSKTCIGMYELVARSRLVPYHGGEEKDDSKSTKVCVGEEEKGDDDLRRHRWCPILTATYLKQLKKDHKVLGDVQLRTEELYLERVLQRAFEEKEQTMRLQQYDVMATEEPQEGRTTKEEEEGERFTNENNQNGDSDQETNNGVRRSKRKWNQLDDSHTEWLHCGDVIRFYKPGFAAGDARFLCEATVTSIRPREDPSLVVDCEGEWYMVVPNDHPVMRIKRMERGGLVENVGCCYRPVENYTLKREGGNHAVKEVIDKRVRKVREITERNKQIAMQNIERDGCGPTDMFR